MKTKIILKACDIPEGETVIKKTGSTPYVLKRTIKMYPKGVHKDIVAHDDTVFLLDTNSGNLNSYSGDTEFIVVFKTTQEALDYLEDVEYNE